MLRRTKHTSAAFRAQAPRDGASAGRSFSGVPMLVATIGHEPDWPMTTS